MIDAFATARARGPHSSTRNDRSQGAAGHAARPGRHGQRRRGAEAAGCRHGGIPAPVHHGPDLDLRQEFSGRGPDRPAGLLDWREYPAM